MSKDDASEELEANNCAMGLLFISCMRPITLSVVISYGTRSANSSSGRARMTSVTILVMTFEDSMLASNAPSGSPSSVKDLWAKPWMVEIRNCPKSAKTLRSTTRSQSHDDFLRLDRTVCDVVRDKVGDIPRFPRTRTGFEWPQRFSRCGSVELVVVRVSHRCLRSLPY